MVYGTIDPTKRIFSFSTGGQYPLPVISGIDGSEFIEARGLPVGILARAEYRQSEIPLSERFTIHCFSDGVFELLPGTGLEEKNEEMLDLIRNNDWNREQWLNHFLGSRDGLPDDVTLLKIEGGF